MKYSLRFITALAISAALVFSGCSNTSGEKKEKSTESHESSERGEHARDVGESGEGEEDGTQIGINDSYEGVRSGVHMTLAYDAEKDGFVGVVKNTTEKVVSQVRVEVHLSNGVELGPTPRADLEPGAVRNIFLSAENNSFKTWSTHAESGEEEGHGEEGEGGEHGGEGESEGEGEHK